MTLETNDGTLNIFSGASRSGKTALCVRLVTQHHKQAFIWDTQGQWAGIRGYHKVTLQELAKICLDGRKGRFCYVPKADLKTEFNTFCACVYHYAAHFGNCAVVAEELADVTTVNKAPSHWGILLRRSLKYGVHIYPISQRWAEADKTAIGNATNFYVFRAVGDDVSYIAKKTRLPVTELERLQKLEYIHFDAVTGKIDKVKKVF